MSLDLWEMANRVDEIVDRLFAALPDDLARVHHELNGLRRLCAQAREETNAYVDTLPEPKTQPLAIADMRVRDVLLRHGAPDSYWRVLRVRRKRHQVDVVDQEGRQRIYNVCEFCQRWSELEARRLNLRWRY